MTDINSKLIRMSREYNNSMPWLENAEEQHIADPFRAIISDLNPRNIPKILIAADLDNATPLWNVIRGECIPRSALDMAKRIRPMLQLCSEVLFVDPHFNPSELRYRNTLEQFIKSTNKNTKISRIEYHLGDKIENNHFEGECKNKLPRLLPKGSELTFIRWRQLEEGEKLHPRYILTDIGGIRIEVGLDEGEVGETTDISLLAEREYYQRWGNFQRSTAAYEFVDELKVIGELDII